MITKLSNKADAIRQKEHYDKVRLETIHGCTVYTARNTSRNAHLPKMRSQGLGTDQFEYWYKKRSTLSSQQVDSSVGGRASVAITSFLYMLRARGIMDLFIWEFSVEQDIRA